MIVDIHHLLTRATNENIRWIQEIERALKDRHIGTRRAVQKMKLLRIDSFLHARHKFVRAKGSGVQMVTS